MLRNLMPFISIKTLYVTISYTSNISEYLIGKLQCTNNKIIFDTRITKVSDQF